MKFFQGNTKSPTAAAIKQLKDGITVFEMDSAHFPIPKPDWHGPDVSLRTRGPIVLALLGRDAALNPKDIKFIDFPIAVAHKNGLWQDGAEWVLSDLWGEPYYVVLDTNKDGVVGNPEVKEEHLSEILSQRVIIYSSGPDHDPKTWKDNICSWRP